MSRAELGPRASASTSPAASTGGATSASTSRRGSAGWIAPLPVAALLDAARADVEVAEALLVKQPPPIRRALAESEEKGRREGEEKGRREGEEKGRTAGKAEAVLAVLEARGLEVTGALRRRILKATDPGEVDQWLRRAAVVQKAKELFGDRP